MKITSERLEELGWIRLSTGIPIIEFWGIGYWVIIYDASEEEILEMRWRKDGIGWKNQ